MSHKHPTYERLLCSLVALLTMTGTEAATTTGVPRLVVNIVLDQLRSDYLETFEPLYGEGGFRRLLSEGCVYMQAGYPFNHPDRASAVASLSTGATPSDHGIISQKWINRSTLTPVFCVDDSEFQGWNTPEKTSAQHLLVSTFADELKIATDGRALVYSISPYRDAAVLAAGHSADGVFWLSDQTGKWCGSSYYGQEPTWLRGYLEYNDLDKRLSHENWKPINTVAWGTNFSLSRGENKLFSHKFTGTDRFRRFKTSAMVNTEVNGLVHQCLVSTRLGNDDVTDYLSVTFNAGNFNHASASAAPMELQDTYVRLDACLSDLIKDVEQSVGAGNALFVVSGTGCSGDEERGDLTRFRIPTGEFSIHRASALLNLYLMGTYGQGQFVEAYYDNQIYLNHKLIEDKQLNLVDVLERAQDFLIQMAGVRDVFTSNQLVLGASSSGSSLLRNSYNPRCSGDLFIVPFAGWKLVDENASQSRLIRASYISFPLVFLGAGIKAETIQTPVDVTCVAPTLSGAIHIRAPNACAAKPLPLKR